MSKSTVENNQGFCQAITRAEDTTGHKVKVPETRGMIRFQNKTENMGCNVKRGVVLLVHWGFWGYISGHHPGVLFVSQSIEDSSFLIILLYGSTAGYTKYVINKRWIATTSTSG